MKRQTRRDFLACSGIGALGMMAGGVSFAETNQPESGKTEMNGTYQYKREIPIGDTYDLVVAGGGPAGAAAAISAARLGAKVLLVEATGCMGGTGTSGLVTIFLGLHNGKQMIVGGLMKEIYETLQRRDFVKSGPFQVEGYKLVLDELAVNAGVNIQFFTRVIDVDADAKQGKVTGFILSNIEGHRYIKAKAFIDCTGDAYIAKLCGVTCREAGTDTPTIMPPTLCGLVTGYDISQLRGVNQQKLVYKGFEDGTLSQKDRHLPGLFPGQKSVGFLNVGHMFNLNALRCKDLTDGVMLGRRLVQEYINFYKKHVPGCENLELIVTADIIGIRESRRILGEYELNINDYLARRTFPDQIGLNCYPVDIHIQDTSDEEWKRFTEESGIYLENGKGKARYGPGEQHGIPYSILVPKGGWKNLWVAGRSVSSDVQVHGAIRVQSNCSMMGQAAGTAAVQSIKTGQPANDLNTEMLVMTLRKAGAFLPQDSLSKSMTRI